MAHGMRVMALVFFGSEYTRRGYWLAVLVLAFCYHDSFLSLSIMTFACLAALLYF